MKCLRSFARSILFACTTFSCLLLCGCCANTLSADPAATPEVVVEYGHLGSDIKIRLYIFDGQKEDKFLSAIKTFFTDGTYELRHFRPDRTSSVRAYKDGKVACDTELDETGLVLRARSYKYRTDGTLDQVHLLEGAVRVIPYSADGKTKLPAIDVPEALPKEYNPADQSNSANLLPARNPSASGKQGTAPGALARLGQVVSAPCQPLDKAAIPMKLLLCFTPASVPPDMAVEKKSIPSLDCETCPAAPGDFRVTMPVDGVARECLLHLPPAYDGKKRLPIVIVLHGSFLNNDYMVRLTRLNWLADQAGIIVAYPNATGWFGNHVRCWNVGKSPLYRTNDLLFIDRLIDTSIERLAADADRVYLAGFSMGAAMAHEAGIKLEHKLAAIACVSGWLTGDESAPRQPLPVLIMHGTADAIVPYTGRLDLTTLLLPTMQPVAFSRQFWVNHNQCDRQTITMESQRVVKETCRNSKTGIEVTQYTIFGGEHAWPGSLFRNIAGNPSQDMDASDVIWEFFSRQRRLPATK